jgi:hypothetical protein
VARPVDEHDEDAPEEHYVAADGQERREEPGAGY